MWRPVLATVLVLALAGCVAPGRTLQIDPELDYENAVLEGFPAAIRFWGDLDPGIDTLVETTLSARAARRDRGDTTLDVLAISSGGANGAFGAGILRGWTEAGNRPEFDVVTGVSTGAIIAPFAFLGPEYDDDLERFYTFTRTSDLLDFTFFQALRGGPSLTDTTPLREIMEQSVTPELLQAIAAEHAKGRRLLIGSTNLDAQRPVIWDIGAIASSGAPGAVDLVRNVILASSAIPGVFPPVEFAVRSNGDLYGELHVDGAVTQEVFVLPRNLTLAELERVRGGPFAKRRIWIIMNTKIEPEYAPTRGRLFDITQRTIQTLVKSQTQANILRIENLALRGEADLAFVSIPSDYVAEAEELFDPVAMQSLFQLGRTVGARTDVWRRSLNTPQEPVPRARPAGLGG
ncbi:putative patatin/cPLA2 family phospholipase [Rubricella aquisinus]|uniref:Putative patatin/cPLA2 family phospholipase n=1 Tax=Rubricella aquisinus TaxID=2028108 RepID=A0A840X4D7_9RHOB|nr:patatin-like phospholipase family protein [Rubricella aquisinus]MBB5515537.1 putative patatin/cPLA2 family phospholipase [Rubricella aquisinus]